MFASITIVVVGNELVEAQSNLSKHDPKPGSCELHTSFKLKLFRLMELAWTSPQPFHRKHPAHHTEHGPVAEETDRG